MRRFLALVFALIAFASPVDAQRMSLQGVGRYVAPAGGGTTATWNPSDKHANVSLSGGNLIASGTTSGYFSARGTAAIVSGNKYYGEFVMNSVGGSDMAIGLANSSANLADYISAGGGNSIGYFLGYGLMLSDTPVSGYGSGWADNDRVGFAINGTTQRLYIRVNGGSWLNSGDPVAGTGGADISALGATIYVALTFSLNTESITANFGNSAFVDSVPSGYTAFP